MTSAGDMNNLYSGAFAFTSPPNRLMLSDTASNQYAAINNLAGTAAAGAAAGVSSFSTKFTVLRFNSDKKSANASQKRRGLAGTVSGGAKSRKSKGSKVSRKSRCSEFQTNIFGEAVRNFE